MSEKTLPLNEAKLWEFFKRNETKRFKLFHERTVFIIFKIIGSYTLLNLLNLLNNYFWSP